MAKFKYKMQSILSIKEKLEGQAKVEFGTARRELDLELDRLLALQKERERYLNEGKKLREGSVKLRDINDNRNYIEKIEYLEEEQNKRIDNAKKKLEEKRIALTSVRQERMMQEKLRDKAFERFLEEENAAEALENDQHTSFIYGQKTMDK